MAQDQRSNRWRAAPWPKQRQALQNSERRVGGEDIQSMEALQLVQSPKLSSRTRAALGSPPTAREGRERARPTVEQVAGITMAEAEDGGGRADGDWELGTAAVNEEED